MKDWKRDIIFSWLLMQIINLYSINFFWLIWARIMIIVQIKFISFLSILILIASWFLKFSIDTILQIKKKRRVFWRWRFFKLKSRRFNEEMSKFVDCSQFDQMKAEFEFDLIKILSSLIFNAKRIFIKTVIKKSRDKV